MEIVSMWEDELEEFLAMSASAERGGRNKIVKNA